MVLHDLQNLPFCPGTHISQPFGALKPRQKWCRNSALHLRGRCQRTSLVVHGCLKGKMMNDGKMRT